MSQAVIPQIGELIAKTDLPDSVKQSLIATAGTLIGAGVGGSAGAAAAGNATVNNYLNHTDVSKLAEQLKQCGTDQKCRADAMNQAYASSAANDIALLNCKGAGTCDTQQAAYRQGYNSIQDLVNAGLSPNDVSAMLNMESNAQTIIRNGLYNNQCSSDQCVSNAKFLTGLGTGLANLTPAGMVAGTGVVAYQLTTSIINSGATETATAVARGLTGLPADLMAGLNSADPQVRGEALVNALAIGWVATAVGTKLGLTVLDNIGTGPVSGSLGAQRGGVKIPGAGGAAQEGGAGGSGANGGVVEASVTSGGTANAATVPGLKGQLAAENLANIAAQDARLAKAVSGDGGKLNFSVGSGTAAEANQLGKTWVGDGAQLVADQVGCPGCWKSADGLRIYRPPTPKNAPSSFNPTGVQANFVTLSVNPATGSSTIVGNGHLVVLP